MMIGKIDIPITTETTGMLPFNALGWILIALAIVSAVLMSYDLNAYIMPALVAAVGLALVNTIETDTRGK